MRSSAPELPFEIAEYSARLGRVRQSMEGKGLDVLLLTSLPNIFYLTGYQTANQEDYCCLILPRDDEPALVLWEPEALGVPLTSWIEEMATYPTGGDAVAATVRALQERALDGGRIGLESKTPSYFMTPAVYERLREALSKATLEDESGLVEMARAVKSPAELGYIRQAGEITVRGMIAAMDAVRAGGADNEVAAVAYQVMTSEGSEYMCYAPFVTAGARSGAVHTTFKRKGLKRGDIVFIEIGACIQRYSAPFTRVAFIGDSPDEVKQIFRGALTGLEDVQSMLRPGVKAEEAAAAGQKGIAMAGEGLIYHGVFGYSVGAGFPPTWADAPLRLVRGNPRPLEAGMVFHMPLNIRAPGRYTVGLSETVVITDDGYEVITPFARELILK
jgi:Xaa-Pro dipeptidase